jgi:hypothetical protein
MASQQEKAFCVLRFEVSRSVITVKHEFSAQFRPAGSALTLPEEVFRFFDMVSIELNTSTAYVSVLTVVRDNRVEHVSVYHCCFVICIV